MYVCGDENQGWDPGSLDSLKVDSPCGQPGVKFWVGFQPGDSPLPLACEINLCEPALHCFYRKEQCPLYLPFGVALKGGAWHS